MESNNCNCSAAVHTACMLKHCRRSPSQNISDFQQGQMQARRGGLALQSQPGMTYHRQTGRSHCSPSHLLYPSLLSLSSFPLHLSLVKASGLLRSPIHHTHQRGMHQYCSLPPILQPAHSSASWQCHHVQMCPESHSPPAASLQLGGKKQAHILPAPWGARYKGQCPGFMLCSHAPIAAGLTAVCRTDWSLPG